MPIKKSSYKLFIDKLARKEKQKPEKVDRMFNIIYEHYDFKHHNKKFITTLINNKLTMNEIIFVLNSFRLSNYKNSWMRWWSYQICTPLTKLKAFNEQIRVTESDTSVLNDLVGNAHNIRDHNKSVIEYWIIHKAPKPSDLLDEEVLSNLLTSDSEMENKVNQKPTNIITSK